MMRLTRHAGLLVAFSLLISSTACAEGTWVPWSNVSIMKDGKIADQFFAAEAFTSKAECEKAAMHYEEKYKGRGD